MITKRTPDHKFVTHLLSRVDDERVDQFDEIEGIEGDHMEEMIDHEARQYETINANEPPPQFRSLLQNTRKLVREHAEALLVCSRYLISVIEPS